MEKCNHYVSDNCELFRGCESVLYQEYWLQKCITDKDKAIKYLTKIKNKYPLE